MNGESLPTDTGENPERELSLRVGSSVNSLVREDHEEENPERKDGHETAVDKKIELFEQRKKQYEEEQKKFKDLGDAVAREWEETQDKALKDALSKKHSRISCVRDYSKVRYVASQGELLIDDNPGLADEWKKECEELEDRLFEEGHLSMTCSVLEWALDGMELMEKGASDEEIRAYLDDRGNGYSGKTLALKRFVAHFGSRGKEFADAIGLGDLPQDTHEY